MVTYSTRAKDVILYVIVSNILHVITTIDVNATVYFITLWTEVFFAYTDQAAVIYVFFVLGWGGFVEVSLGACLSFTI